MELPDGLKGDLQRMLLGPLSLGEEIMVALLPGCTFLVLLALKHTPALYEALSSPFFGYRTKIACGLLIAYVIGKASTSVFTSIVELKGADSSPKEFEIKGQKFTLNSSAAMAPGALTAANVRYNNSILEEKHSAFVIYRRSSFALAVLIGIAAFIPGDGKFRILEAVVACVFLLRSYTAGKAEADFVVSLIWRALSERLAQLPLSEQIDFFKALAATSGAQPTAPTDGDKRQAVEQVPTP